MNNRIQIIYTFDSGSITLWIETEEPLQAETYAKLAMTASDVNELAKVIKADQDRVPF